MELTSAVVLVRNGETVWSHAGGALLHVRPLSEEFIYSYLEADWPEVSYCVGVFRLEGPGVQLFESKGAIVGASNPHPHGQVWASTFLPNEALAEDAQQRRYLTAHGSPLLVDYAARELDLGERVVVENEHWLVVVPYWAYWPFETLVLPRSSASSLDQLTDAERTGLADILHQLTRLYDHVFDVSFPYSMGLHGRPTDGQDHPEWLLHLHFYPPLLRSATVRKFMVGFELLGSPQRDITPEGAAETLRTALAKSRAATSAV